MFTLISFGRRLHESVPPYCANARPGSLDSNFAYIAVRNMKIPFEPATDDDAREVCSAFQLCTKEH